MYAFKRNTIFIVIFAYSLNLIKADSTWITSLPEAAVALSDVLSTLASLYTQFATGNPEGSESAQVDDLNVKEENFLYKYYYNTSDPGFDAAYIVSLTLSKVYELYYCTIISLVNQLLELFSSFMHSYAMPMFTAAVNIFLPDSWDVAVDQMLEKLPQLAIVAGFNAFLDSVSGKNQTSDDANIPRLDRSGNDSSATKLMILAPGLIDENQLNNKNKTESIAEESNEKNNIKTNKNSKLQYLNHTTESQDEVPEP